MKRLTYITALLATALASCTSGTATGDERPLLCVSIEPQRKMLEELAGDRYRVTSMLAKGADPESFDPSMTQRADLGRSTAYFITGMLPFEEVLTEGLDPEITLVCNTSAGIEPVTGTHCHGHDDAPDPHIWASARNARVLAANMRDALKQIDPEGASGYDDRYARMAARYDSLDAAFAASLDSARVHAFAVWHPSLSYYARDYGLHQIAAGQESKEMSVGRLRSIIEEARADSVQVFFFQKEYDSRQASNINEEVGSRLVPLNPVEYDWEAELSRVTHELVRGL